LVFVSVLLLGAQQPAAPPTANGGSAQNVPVPVIASPESESDPALVARRLLSVKRIYVDSFGDDLISKQVQAMVMAALTESKRFVITENKERADAVLKGTAVEKTSQELHSYGEGTAVAGAAGGHSGSVSGSWVGGTGSVQGSSSGGFASRAASIQDSAAHTETVDNARLAVRLVASDGDVIWATTQESRGAKYRGASADMADKVVKQLLRDLEKLDSKKNDVTPPKVDVTSPKSR